MKHTLKLRGALWAINAMEYSRNVSGGNHVVEKSPIDIFLRDGVSFGFFFFFLNGLYWPKKRRRRSCSCRGMRESVFKHCYTDQVRFENR